MLHIPLDYHLYLSDAAPSIKLGNNAVPASSTMFGLLAMATTAGHYGLQAGDVILAAYGNFRGNLYINSNYSGTGTTNVIIQPSLGNVGIGTASPYATLDARTSVRLTNTRQVTGTVVTNSSAALTLTAANMAKNSIFQETGSTAAMFTLDNGTNLSAAVPNVQVGDAIFFVVSNASTATVTMAGATGTTLANVMTVATLQSRTFWAVNTGSNTWTIY